MASMSGGAFDLGGRLEELRCHTTGWLESRLDELVSEQRALKVEELAVRRILDERGEADLREHALKGAHNESPRTARQNLEMARLLESLPAIAAAAHAGELSPDQLKPPGRDRHPRHRRPLGRARPQVVASRSRA